jgi:SAM-dependent methyltransferase
MRILELGAGTGRNIEVLSYFGQIDAVEIEPIAIKTLKNCLHLQHLYSHKVPFLLEEKYDLICAMDFLEHIQDDKQAFDWIADHLTANGILFLTVPAYQFLFSDHDIALCHFRRYSIKDIIILNDAKLSLLKKGYFNSLLFPFAALSRLLSRFFSGMNNGEEKQSCTVSPNLDWFLYSILRIEVDFIKKYDLFPFGLTAFALFRKT